MKNPFVTLLSLLILAACGGGGGGGNLNSNITPPAPIQSCQDTPISLSENACATAEMQLAIITAKSADDISQNTNTVTLSGLSLIQSDMFEGYDYVAGLQGNGNEVITYVPMTGTLPTSSLTYTGRARVETVHPNNQSNAFRVNMKATVNIDLTQNTQNLDVVLFDATDHQSLTGNATVHKTGAERVRINGVTLNATTGHFAAAQDASIVQSGFIETGQVKTYASPIIVGGLAGPQGAEVGLVAGAQNNGTILMQIVGQKQN